MKPIVLIAIFIILSTVSISLPLSGMLVSGPQVVRVIDGDTVVLDTGEHVRLLGIDTPEKGQPFARDAAELTTELTLGKRVTLERDETDKDKYGRLLRYLWIDGQLLEERLLANGFATVLIILPDRKYEERLRIAESVAHDASSGVWSLSGEWCLGVYGVHSNARGRDNDNLADEWVSFRNKCTHALSLTGWTVRDEWGTAFVFPPFSLERKSIVTLHTGSGENNRTNVFWNQSRAIWNNAGDTVLVWDPSGQLQLNYTYAW